MVMSLGSLSGSQCRVTLHNSTIEVTFVGGGSGSRCTGSIDSITYVRSGSPTFFNDKCWISFVNNR